MSNSPSPDALQVDTLQGIPVARLTDRCTRFDQAVQRVTALIRQLVDQGESHLLLDASLVPFAAPTLAERLDMVRGFALAADGRLRIAMVTRADFIDPERFGVVAAGGFGLAAQVFDREADALAWLHEEHAAALRR